MSERSYIVISLPRINSKRKKWKNSLESFRNRVISLLIRIASIQIHTLHQLRDGNSDVHGSDCRSPVCSRPKSAKASVRAVAAHRTARSGHSGSAAIRQGTTLRPDRLCRKCGERIALMGTGRCGFRPAFGQRNVSYPQHRLRRPFVPFTDSPAFRARQSCRCCGHAVPMEMHGTDLPLSRP